MHPIIDRIHITFSELTRAEKFYDKLLSILGFDPERKERDTVPENEYSIVECHDKIFPSGLSARGRSASERGSAGESQVRSTTLFSAQTAEQQWIRFIKKVSAVPVGNNPSAAVLS